MKLNILVTGGAGYIGSHTVNTLLNDPRWGQVVVYDNLTTGFRESVGNAAIFVHGDVRDEEHVYQTLRQYQIAAVIHFAAKLIVPESVSRPLEYYENNVGGVIATLKACQRAGVKVFVFSSTAAVYGEQQKLCPIDENTPPHPANPYGWSKWMSEQIIRDSLVGWGLRSVVLRYFNVAGAAPDGKNGQRTVNATHLIKVAAEAASGQRSQVHVFGYDYPTVDGTGVRDYIHVQDLADVHVRALAYLFENPQVGHETLNCGYGRGYSVLQVLQTMKKVSGRDFPWERVDRRPGDVAYLVADPSRLQKLLQWKPLYDRLDFICETAYRWELQLRAISNDRPHSQDQVPSQTAKMNHL